MPTTRSDTSTHPEVPPTRTAGTADPRRPSTTPDRPADGVRFSPRVIEVTDVRHPTVAAYVEATGVEAHFRRRGGETVLVVR